MAQKKRTAPKKNQKQKKVEEKNRFANQIKAIVIMAISIFLLAIVLIPVKNLGSAGAALKSVCFGLFGFCAYIFPVVLGYIAIMIALEKKQSNTVTIVFALLFGLFLDTAFEIFGHSISNVGFFTYVADSYTIANNSFGGGVLGSLLSYPLVYFLGNPLSNITVIILIVAALMITTGTTLQSVGIFAKKTGKKAQQIHNETKEWIHQQREEKEERNKDTKPKFDVDVSLEGMPEHPAVLDDLYKEKERISADKKAKKEASEIDIAVEPENPEPIDFNKKAAEKAAASIAAAAKAKKAEKAEKTEKKQSEQKKKQPEEKQEYVFPPLELLSPTKNANAELVDAELRSNCELLVNVLKSFGVEVRVTGYSRGPSVTRYEIQPAIGVRISKITGLADDVALQLRAESVRISPIPNKSTLGIEVPNTNSSTVGMRDIIDSDEFKKSKSKLRVALGKDVTGQTAFCDISKMPHLLVAGTTGSGKSVCLNAMIMSILYKADPEQVKFVMIDPKSVEFPIYNGIPHLLVPVVTDSRKAAGALGWAVVEMEKRYNILKENKVRNIDGYNELCKKNSELEPMPHIVIIIDEFADLMMVAKNEVESSVCRIAQKARAAGMHLVIATQRPSADIFTGLIKSNIPSRIALSVSSKVNSQIIIDMLGAEKLLGKGDMLYLPIGAQKPHRIQGCYIDEKEIKSIVEFIVEHSEENEYDQEVLCEIDRQTIEDDTKKSAVDDGDFGDYDARINEAIEEVVESGTASTSFLQRRMKLGYSRAARIMDQLEEKGIIGPQQGSKPREVLITRQDWMQMQTSGVAATAPKMQAHQLSFDETADETDDEGFDDYEDISDETLKNEAFSDESNEDNDEFEDFVSFETESEPEEVVFTDDNEPSVNLDKDEAEDDDDNDDDLDFIDEDFLGSI